MLPENKCSTVSDRCGRWPLADVLVSLFLFYCESYSICCFASEKRKVPTSRPYSLLWPVLKNKEIFTELACFNAIILIKVITYAEVMMSYFTVIIIKLRTSGLCLNQYFNRGKNILKYLLSRFDASITAAPRLVDYWQVNVYEAKRNHLYYSGFCVGIRELNIFDLCDVN